ncbi:MAG: hypothetical protein QF645_00280 [Planctomycetota bacterium]|nr:hypothetical protein [Planctomycetota bacterium]
MSDLSKVYRYWLARRLFMLIPAWTGAGLLATHQLFQMVNQYSMLWIHFACLCLSLFLFSLTTWLIARCFSCYFSHQKVNLAQRKRARRELAPAGLMGMVCFAVLPALSLLPATFQDISTSLPNQLLEVSRLLKKPVEPLPEKEIESTPSIEVASRSGRMKARPAPPVPVDIPMRTKSIPSETLAIETQPAYIYDFQEEEEKADPWSFSDAPNLSRLGVPDKLKPFEWMLPQIQAEFFILERTTGSITDKEQITQSLEDDLSMESAGLRINFDLPVNRDNSVIFLYRPIGFSANQTLSENSDNDLDSFLLWQRLGVLFSHRLLGYTSESKFDLALTAGIVGDSLLTSASGDVISELIRFSPYLGVELGLWQHGPAGILLNINQSFPTNASGASARITEISALLRIDFTQKFSLQLGFIGIYGQFRAHSGKMTRSGSREEMEVILQGPTFGLDFRF